MNTLYPAGPPDVPKDFTQPTARYRWEVALVLISLLLSLALYLVLVAGTAWLCYILVTAPWPVRAERGYVFFRIVAIVSSGLMFLYLLKGLFKGSHQDQSLLVEITEAEQPDLFDFIRRICADTGAPFPHKIFLTPEVNAAVFYQSSFLSLILPTPKNLLIGLGLVNMVNLSEFKAVLAHEFGHFSQKSMKVGSYVYIANKVLADIIYGRDFLDDIIHQVKHWDLRIAVFAWIFLGLLWVLRKFLELIFKAINIFNLSLSRQMEFNADRMAVSVAGSDAIVYALLRSGFADQAFRQMGADLWSAADHQLYSADIFHHQIPAAEQLRRRAKNPKLGQPPAERGADVQAFKPGEGDLGIPVMWSTHPPNHDREKNAKEIYLSADLDERSPWLLFRDPAKVRLAVSKRYYEAVHKPEGTIEFTDPHKVQKFFDEEYAETTYADHYHGFYDNRYLEIPRLEELFVRAQTETPAEQAVQKLQTIMGPALETWVKEHWARLDEQNLLFGVQSGQFQLKNKTVDFRGKAHPPSAVPTLLETVQKELDADQAHTAEIDAEIFIAHRQLAKLQDAAVAQELADRYRFHLGIQDLHRLVTQGAQDAQMALNYAGGRREMTPEEFAYVRDTLRQAAFKLHSTLDQSEKLRMPALRNMAGGESLREFLLHKPVVGDLGADQNTIEPGWMQRLLAQIGEVQDKSKRLLFKSLGAILILQEQILQKQQTNANPSS